MNVFGRTFLPLVVSSATRSTKAQAGAMLAAPNETSSLISTLHITEYDTFLMEGMIMTISVSPNSNGTITITCGNDSVTIGAPAAPKDAPPETPILWPNGGATASIIASGKAKTKVIRVPSRDNLLKAIREQHDLYAQAPETTIFQFHVQGPEPLSVEEIDKTLSDLGNPAWMGTQIKLTGAGDE